MWFLSWSAWIGCISINGHEWLKRQLTKAGVKYEALDNGLLRCRDPKQAQALADSLSAAEIDALLGLKLDQLSTGRVTYDLRRLRLHGLIERLPGTHRYRLTERGIQIATFWTRTYNRLLRPGLAQLADPACESPPLRRKLDALTHAIDQAVAEARIAA